MAEGTSWYVSACAVRERIAVVLEVAVAKRTLPVGDVIDEVDQLKRRIREHVPAVKRVSMSVSVNPSV